MKSLKEFLTESKKYNVTYINKNGVLDTVATDNWKNEVMMGRAKGAEYWSVNASNDPTLTDDLIAWYGKGGYWANVMKTKQLKASEYKRVEKALKAGQELHESICESQLPTYQVKMLGNLDYDEASKSLLLEFFKYYGNALKVISGSMNVDSGTLHIEWKDNPKMIDISYNHHNQQAMIEGEDFNWKEFQKLVYSKKNWLILSCEKYRK